jgi:polysaccharide export outer membrane protein
MRNIGLVVLAASLVGGCASGNLADSNSARGEAAYAAIAPAVPQSQSERDYHIGPLDTLAISVYQEPEISTPANAPLQVDANGNITMPLIGTVPAAGKTATELAAVIADRLSTKYLENPQVNVQVASSVSQKVTVQGEVMQAGVYDIRGPTTLLGALSLARGETRVAALSQVLVYREVNGKRVGALFNVEQIRKGILPDPEILGNDVVVVGYSKGKAIWRDILSTSPLLGVFRPF